MVRDRARLFDREAERYDRVRPGYPRELIDTVLGPSPGGLAVLDVASGTGLASRPMMARGARVLGVELNPRMAELARRHGVLTEVSAFETWDPAGRTFDLAVCAQAWHWLDPAAAPRKIADVLRPGGRLCVFWNVGRHSDRLAEALDDVYRRALPDAAGPQVIGYGANRAGDAGPAIGAVVEGLQSTGAFVCRDTKCFPWTRRYTRDDWLEELQTHSDHAALPPELRERVLAGVGGAIDRFGGTFDMPFSAVLIAAERT